MYNSSIMPLAQISIECSKSPRYFFVITVALRDTKASKGNISIKPYTNRNRTWTEGARFCYERAKVKLVQCIPFFIFRLSTCFKICGRSVGRQRGGRPATGMAADPTGAAVAAEPTLSLSLSLSLLLLSSSVV